jgi:hypothetical protein
MVDVRFSGGPDRDANGVPYDYGNAQARKAYAARMRKAQRKMKRLTGKPGTSDGK